MPKGGDFIAKGSYGCVYDHEIKCTNIQNIPRASIPKKIYSKVFDSDKEAEIEWNNSKIIATIDKNYESFIYAYEKCSTTRKELEKNNTFKKCDLHFDNNKITLLKLPYGGISYSSYTVKSFEEFIKSTIPLFEGLVKLNNINKIHQDIKQENILFDETNNRWRYIDYGFLIDAKKIYSSENSTTVNGNYFPCPPEYRIKNQMSYLNADSIIETEKNIYTTQISDDSVYTYNDLFKLYISDKEYKLAIDLFVNHIKSLPFNSTTQELEKYINKIDVYSLGLTLMCLYTISSIDIVHSKEYEKKYKKYINLIKRMIFPDPRKRYSPEEALKKVKSI